jgi:hypothetical protein
MLNHKSRLGFGIFVITASLLTSACAVKPQMAHRDLDNFQIDCKIKPQQIDFLVSQRLSTNERILQNYSRIFAPWRSFTNPARARTEAEQGSGRTNWLIGQHLLALSRDCP